MIQPIVIIDLWGSVLKSCSLKIHNTGMCLYNPLAVYVPTVLALIDLGLRFSWLPFFASPQYRKAILKPYPLTAILWFFLPPSKWKLYLKWWRSKAYSINSSSLLFKLMGCIVWISSPRHQIQVCKCSKRLWKFYDDFREWRSNSWRVKLLVLIFILSALKH